VPAGTGAAVEIALELGAKTLAGGLLVVLFALVSEVVEPKRFSGVFAAAPAVALAGLAVGGVAKGAGSIRDAAEGMIAGGFAIVVYCAVVVLVHRRLDALRGAGLAIAAWFAAAAVAYVVVAQ
jgi:uncharacterized membrane protein (GlpM family)